MEIIKYQAPVSHKCAVIFRALLEEHEHRPSRPFFGQNDSVVEKIIIHPCHFLAFLLESRSEFTFARYQRILTHSALLTAEPILERLQILLETSLKKIQAADFLKSEKQIKNGKQNDVQGIKG